MSTGVLPLSRLLFPVDWSHADWRHADWRHVGTQHDAFSRVQGLTATTNVALLDRIL